MRAKLVGAIECDECGDRDQATIPLGSARRADELDGMLMPAEDSALRGTRTPRLSTESIDLDGAFASANLHRPHRDRINAV